MKIKWTPSLMGKKGGKKSAQKRFNGLNKEEISKRMGSVRKGKKVEWTKEWNEEDAKRNVEFLKECGQIKD